MKPSELESRLVGAVRARGGALLEDLRLHVGLPTGGGNAAALDETRERFALRLGAIGAKTELVPGEPKPEWLYGVRPGASVPPALVARRAGAAAGPAVLLSGHLDTVHDPKGPFRQLSVAPDGKTATGPGCVDMKGGLVVMVGALEVLAEVGIDIAWTMVLNSDEETGSYHSERVLREEARHAAADGQGGVGLVVEPALPDGSLVVERAGSGQFLIECRGKAAHVGRDFTSGVSAVTRLAECILAVAKMPDPARAVIANIGPVEGGNATNVVPDLAKAWGNVRFPDQSAADELEKRLLALASGRPELFTAVLTSFNRPAKPMTPRVEKLAMLARACAADLGQALPFGKTGGVCDGNILQSEGLPTIDTLGVRGGGLHTPQEWIDLSSLVERCSLLALLIARLASGAGGAWGADRR